MTGSTLNVLLTGGTGFLGKAVLARLVDEPRYDRIYLLVRPKQDQNATERVATIVRRMFPKGRVESLLARIHAVPGDLTQTGLGIDPATLDELALHVHQILHLGASTDFGAPLNESRLNNVEGTRHVLDLALHLKERGRLERFDYVSTAYVSGKQRGRVSELDLNRGQSFSNNYELSKFEAELLVREYASRLNLAIYRPSIVVGDSMNGYTPHFKVLYWPLLLLAKNLLPFFTCNPRAYLDIVPVDYVANGLVVLMQRKESVGETFHLTAGLGSETRIREVLLDSYSLAGIKPRPIVPMWLFFAIRRSPFSRLFGSQFWRAVDMAKPYYDYLRGTGVRFDATRTHAVLRPLGITPPRWREYKKEVLNYCLASRWGRKVPIPEYVYYLPVSRVRGT